jgi:hypothetical protein
MTPEGKKIHERCFHRVSLEKKPRVLKPPEL